MDIFYPKTIRSAMGSIYRVPFVYTEDLSQAIKTMQKAGVRVYAAHLKGEHYYDEVDYCGSAAGGNAADGSAADGSAAGGNAFLIGNEGNGLKDETAGLADEYIKIPMEGRVESLNAAVATSILMYEHHRQSVKK